ncbi:branched-chain amino acid ABC transporter substrate-binding protein [Corticibacter populi]|uniref:Branched-chain amino acid ABC transporter substrate-binding protein n=1 Tax=Corticibacter populi TaxID=1550736 RepID=A0A3M6QSN5_9BURK|nr:branched-chain amino acid ABC transporter substrate-binding protein [Corticibacter populi]RMX06046.1 branched-chain amino acid ABC transporter substrate-binding protein [Corticibacter populi]RZS30878.1 amino acid/amide ABC transporter substrate-binding protein (HAAT family) [Corticibacter populi]
MFSPPSRAIGAIAAAGLAALLAHGSSHAADTYRIAYIDPLSGPFSAVGELMLNHIQFAVEDINAQGGVLGGTELELLKFDSKLSAQESQSALQAAIDQGARAIVTGGSGSSVVTALVQSANRWNQRNPGREVLVLNHSSIDPELTGKTCSFWHFQTEANTAMKMKALAGTIADLPEIRKIYLLNQDYAHGRQWAAYGRQMVGQARPDIQFTGEIFHAIGQVKDFAPYVAGLRQAGADAVITGNWGPDLSLLLKAAGDSGLQLRYFNHSAGAMPGTVTTMSQIRKGDLTWVAEWHPGQADQPQVDALAQRYRQRMGKEFLSPRMDLTPRLLAAAIDKAGQTDSVAVARALEGLRYDSIIGPVEMRAQDHQLLLPQVVNTIAPVDGQKVTVAWEGTDYGFRTDAVFTGAELAQPSDCQMRRP